MINDPTLNILMQGGVGVLPTDTVYGLVARASDTVAVARLYHLKSRKAKPGTIIAASAQQLLDFGFAQTDVISASQYWPGAVSVILPSIPSLHYLDQGVGSLAVRVPADEKLRALLKITGPLLTSSANQPGDPPANSIAEARVYFGQSVDFYVDGGDLSGHKSSTVLRLTDGRPEILRIGAQK